MGNSKVKILVGNHSSNKNERLYDQLILESRDKDDKSKVDLKKKLYLVVPEQDTNEKQRLMMNKAKEYGYGIFNIDVVSFDRIAHYVFDILNIEPSEENIIDDDAKTMILVLILSRLKDKLKYFTRQAKKIGFAEKLTKAMSEFYSYDVDDKVIDEVIEKTNSVHMKNKLQDLKIILSEFKNRLKENSYSIKEDKYDKLKDEISRVDIFNDAIVAFEGFTGFTPVQLMIFKKIVDVAKDVYVLIDLREGEKENNIDEKKLKKADPFYLSKKFILDIAKTIGEEDPNVLVERFEDNNEKASDLMFVENNIYKYQKKDDVSIPDIKNINIYECRNAEEEVINIAHVIIKLLKENNTYKYNDIRVVVPSVNDYTDIIIRIFNKYNIPFFVDDSKTILNSPYIETIRSAIDVVNSDFSYDSVMRYINAGLIEKNNNIFNLDNFIREFGIRGVSRYKYGEEKGKRIDYGFEPIIDHWRKKQEKYAEKKGEKFDFEKSKYYKILETKRKLFDPLLTLYDALNKKKSISSYITAIEEFVKNVDLNNRFDKFLKRLVRFSEDNGIVEKFDRELDVLVASQQVTIKALNSIKSINGIMNDDISIDEFSRLFDVGFVDKGVKTIPHALDQVVIGDFMRSRFYRPKVEICMGMNLSKVPATTTDESIIDDNMRKAFEGVKELSQTTEETALNQRLYIYQALANPTDKLILSYPRLNIGGESDERSSVITSIIDLFDVKDKDIVKRIERFDIDFYQDSDLEDFIAANMPELRRAYMIGEEDSKRKTSSINLATKKAIRYLHNKNNENRDYDISLKSILGRKNYFTAEKLNDKLATELFSISRDGTVGSASSIESFNNCPYKYFLEKTIGLTERKSYEVSSLDLGNFIHKVFEVFFSKVHDLSNIKEKEIDKGLVAASNEALEDVFNFNELKYGEQIFFGSNKLDLIKSVTNDLIKQSILRIQDISKKSEFDNNFEELSFKNEIKNTMENNELIIEGRVDKVELAVDDDNVYVNVVDYKSGSKAKEIELKKVIDGVSIQLILYLDYFKNYNKLSNDSYKNEEISKIMKGKNIIPCGSFYFWVEDPIIQIKSDTSNATEISNIEDLRQDKLAYVGLANKDLNVLKKINKGLDVDDPEKFKSVKDVASRFTVKGEFLKDEDENSDTSFEGVISKVHEKIIDSINRMKTGDIKAIPYEDKNCKYCQFANICRKEMLVDDEDESSEVESK